MISKKTKYGLKALHRLGLEYCHQQPVLIADLASEEKIPKKFLEFILLKLKNAGILHSKMGKGGGYFLAKPPAQMSVGMVIRVLEGPLSPLPCLSQTAYRKCEECVDENTCAIRLVMKEVHEATIKILDNTSLEDMMDKSEVCRSAVMYSI